MDSCYNEDFYLSLVEVMQDLCGRFIRFQHFVEIDGYISVGIDNTRKEKYVISEVIKASGNISRSYCSHVHEDPSSGTSPVGYSSKCIFRMGKQSHENDDGSCFPISKTTGQRSYPVSRFGANASEEPPEMVHQTFSSSCTSYGSKSNQFPSSLKSQTISSGQSQLLPPPGHGHDLIPTRPTRAQSVIIVDDNEPDINHVSVIQQVQVGAAGSPVSTESTLMSPVRPVPALQGQEALCESQIPNVSKHHLEISGNLRSRTKPLTSESSVRPTSVKNTLLSDLLNREASMNSTNPVSVGHDHPSRLPLQRLCDTPQVKDFSRCTGSTIQSKGERITAQAQPFRTSTALQQNSEGKSVASHRRPQNSPVSRRPPIPLPQPIVSSHNSVSDLISVDRQLRTIPIVQLEPLHLYIPNHLNVMPIASLLADVACDTSGPDPTCSQSFDTPLNGGDDGSTVQETITRNTDQVLRVPPEMENTNLAASGMPEISSESAAALTSKVFNVLETIDMPILSPQPISGNVRSNKQLLMDTDERGMFFIRNSGCNKSDPIDSDLEEEIYLMQMEKDGEKEVLQAEEDEVDSTPASAPSTVLSALEKKSPVDRKTLSLRKFTKYHCPKGEAIDLHSLSPKRLNLMLIEFFNASTKSNGRPLSPFSLRSVQLDLESILNSSGYQYSLLTDVAFQSSRHCLSTLLNNNQNPVRDVLNNEDIEILFSEKVLGPHNLISLRNSMWFMATKYLGFKKPMQHTRLKWGDILLKTDNFGKEYLVGSDIAMSKLKAFADPGQGERCFVGLYKIYRFRRHRSTLDAKSAFYLKINKKCNQYSTWAMRPNTIARLWYVMLDKASLPARKRVL